MGCRRKGRARPQAGQVRDPTRPGLLGRRPCPAAGWLAGPPDVTLPGAQAGGPRTPALPHRLRPPAGLSLRCRGSRRTAGASSCRPSTTSSTTRSRCSSTRARPTATTGACGACTSFRRRTGWTVGTRPRPSGELEQDWGGWFRVGGAAWGQAPACSLTGDQVKGGQKEGDGAERAERRSQGKRSRHGQRTGNQREREGDSRTEATRHRHGAAPQEPQAWAVGP